MLVISGIYHFKLTKIGVRRDVCYNCKKQCIAELWQSFQCYHLYWIPLIPLGTQREWKCTLCGADPRRKPAIGGLLKVLSVLLMLIFTAVTLAVWGASPAESGNAGVIWGLRLGFPAIVALLFWATFLRKPKPEPTVEERRALVEPLGDTECFYCRGPLESAPNPHCPTCKVTIYRD